MLSQKKEQAGEELAILGGKLRAGESQRGHRCCVAVGSTSQMRTCFCSFSLPFWPRHPVCYFLILSEISRKTTPKNPQTSKIPNS